METENQPLSIRKMANRVDRNDPAVIDRINAKRYKGSKPKKRVDGNLNYYDHNILGLENRQSSNINEEEFTWYISSERKPHTRGKSQDLVRNFTNIEWLHAEP